MESPVVTPSGKSYERSGIEEWLKNNNTDPLTREPLSVDQLIPNLNLRDAITLWKSLDIEWEQKSARLAETLKKKRKEKLKGMKQDGNMSKKTVAYRHFRMHVNIAKKGRNIDKNYLHEISRIPHRITGETRSRVENALKAILQEDLDTAQPILESLADEMPNDDWIRVRVGWMYHKIAKINENMDYFNKAIDEYQKALKLNTSNAEAYTKWGWALDRYARYSESKKQSKKMRDAVELFETALDLDPEYDEALFCIAFAYRNLNQKKKSIAIFKKVVKKETYYKAPAYSQLGEMMKEKNNFQGALVYFDSAIAADTKSEIWHFKKAKCLLDYAIHGENIRQATRKKYLQRAKASFEESMRLNAMFYWPYNDYGFCLEKLGNLQKAKEYYEKALEINRNDTKAQRLLKSVNNHIARH